LRAAWTGLARVVVVVKTVQRAQQMSRQTRYYLTSLRTRPVAELAAGIRGHWGIENKLHRTRDVHFKQDTNGIRHPRAAVNMALFNTVALNYLLLHVNQAVSYAQLYFAQNFKRFLPVFARWP
jgi:predicted transposase YbfD/YdcC